MLRVLAKSRILEAAREPPLENVRVELLAPIACTIEDRPQPDQLELRGDRRGSHRGKIRVAIAHRA
jgi:hypothetical protein